MWFPMRCFLNDKQVGTISEHDNGVIYIFSARLKMRRNVYRVWRKVIIIDINILQKRFYIPFVNHIKRKSLQG